MNQEILETYFPGLLVKKEDREKCENYLKLKGIERYSSLYFALKSKTENEIDYELLSQHYRYDVKLRRALHKIIAFTEIAMNLRAKSPYKQTIAMGITSGTRSYLPTEEELPYGG